MLEKFENAPLFLWLRLPSTLTRHENEAFQKRSSDWPKDFENVALRFSALITELSGFKYMLKFYVDLKSCSFIRHER